MATIIDLCQIGTLVQITELEPHEQPERYVYGVPNFVEWRNSFLVVQPKDRSVVLTPNEQLENAIRDFEIGAPMAYSVHLRKLDPLQHHVWELKTHDVRVFGFIASRGTFIAISGAMKKDLKPKGNGDDPYAKYITQVRAEMTGMPLSEPKYLTGVRLNDVL